jgi:hypothetical protein
MLVYPEIGRADDSIVANEVSLNQHEGFLYAPGAQGDFRVASRRGPC